MSEIFWWSVIGFFIAEIIGILWQYDKLPDWADNDWFKIPVIVLCGPLLWFMCIVWWIEERVA